MWRQFLNAARRWSWALPVAAGALFLALTATRRRSQKARLDEAAHHAQADHSLDQAQELRERASLAADEAARIAQNLRDRQKLLADRGPESLAQVIKRLNRHAQ